MIDQAQSRSIFVVQRAFYALLVQSCQNAKIGSLLNQQS